MAPEAWTCDHEPSAMYDVFGACELCLVRMDETNVDAQEDAAHFAFQRAHAGRLLARYGSQRFVPEKPGIRVFEAPIEGTCLFSSWGCLNSQGTSLHFPALWDEDDPGRAHQASPHSRRKVTTGGGVLAWELMQSFGIDIPLGHHCHNKNNDPTDNHVRNLKPLLPIVNSSMSTPARNEHPFTGVAGRRGPRDQWMPFTSTAAAAVSFGMGMKARVAIDVGCCARATDDSVVRVMDWEWLWEPFAVHPGELWRPVLHDGRATNMETSSEGRLRNKLTGVITSKDVEGKEVFLSMTVDGLKTTSGLRLVQETWNGPAPSGKPWCCRLRPPSSRPVDLCCSSNKARRRADNPSRVAKKANPASLLTLAQKDGQLTWTRFLSSAAAARSIGVDVTSIATTRQKRFRAFEHLNFREARAWLRRER